MRKLVDQIFGSASNEAIQEVIAGADNILQNTKIKYPEYDVEMMQFTVTSAVVPESRDGHKALIYWVGSYLINIYEKVDEE